MNDAVDRTRAALCLVEREIKRVYGCAVPVWETPAAPVWREARDAYCAAVDEADRAWWFARFPPLTDEQRAARKKLQKVRSAERVEARRSQPSACGVPVAVGALSLPASR